MATLKYVPQYFTTKLNVGGGINDSQTTGIVLLDVSGVDTSKPGQICVSYSDPIDTSVAEWIDYTSINGSNELVGAVRGREGYSAKTHLQDATVAFVVSASHHNDIVDLLNGTEAGIKVKTAIYDANGNEVIKTPATASAVNEVTVTNSATGNAVQLSATGGDTNIDLKLVAKGTGGISDKNGDYLSPNYSMSRQAIINGNFDVWQRGTTFAAFTDDTYGADRWNLLSDGSTTWDCGRSTVIPSTKSSYALYLTNKTANKQSGIVQIIENVDTAKLIGQTVTLSFQAKTITDHLIGKLRCGILAWTGTADAVTSDVVGTWAGNGTNPTLATNWVYENTPADLTLSTDYQTFTATATLDQAGTTNLAVFIWVDDTTISADDSIRITQVQLCAGDVALPFQPKSFNQELLDCMRYYEKSFPYAVAPADNAGRAGNHTLSTQSSFTYHEFSPIRFQVRKRVVPSEVTFYNPSSAANPGTARNHTDGANVAISNNTNDSSEVNLEVFVNNVSIAANKLISFHWAVSAEL